MACIDHTYPLYVFEKKFSGMVLMILDSYFNPSKSTTSNQYFYRKATAAEAQIFMQDYKEIHDSRTMQ